MPIERNEHANVHVWNIWPNDVTWERRIYCSFTKLQMTTLHSLEFEFLSFESWFEELTFVVVLKIVWFKFKYLNTWKVQNASSHAYVFKILFLRNANIQKSMSPGECWIEKRWIERRSYFIREKKYFIMDLIFTMDLRSYRLFHCILSIHLFSIQHSLGNAR